MLKAAYDICVDNTGKLSLPYINKVLEAWHRAGVATPDKIPTEAPNNQRKQATNKSPTDTDEYDQIVMQKAIKEMQNRSVKRGNK